MTLFVLLSYALVGLPTGEPPQSPPERLQKNLLLRQDLFKSGRQQLKAHREGAIKMIKSLQEQMDQVEKLMAASPDIFSPEDLRAMRKDNDKHRQFYANLLKELEEEGRQEKWRDALRYWEQQRKLEPRLETERQAAQSLDKLRRELWPPPAVAPMPREKK